FEGCPCGFPGATGRRPPGSGSRLLAEEHAEEVRKPSSALATGRPELVADVPARAIGPEPERVAAGERIAPGIRIDTRAAVRLPFLAEPVVLRALVGIGQDRVGLVDRLEARLGGLVAGLLVRVMLAGELAEGLLDVGLRSGPRDPE